MAVISKSSLGANDNLLSSKNRRLLCLIVAVVIVVVLIGVGGDPLVSSQSLEELLMLTPTGDVEVKSSGVDANNDLIANGNQDGSSSPAKDIKTLIFHHYKRGKSGTVILDMLMCHAYAYHLKHGYGGSCGEPTKDHPTHMRLLQSVGLQDELRFDCSRDHISNPSVKGRVVPRADFVKDDSRIFIPEYVDFLKTRVKYPPKVPNKYTIAVHIRRDKYTPCMSKFSGFERYLPNKHYQTLIDKHMKPDARVVIFSQNKTFESLDEFREKGYEVHLEDDITKVWRTIAVADVTILSKSRFSFIPAMLTNGTVVYTPFWHKPLRQWQIVQQDVLDETEIEMKRLKTKC